MYMYISLYIYIYIYIYITECYTSCICIYYIPQDLVAGDDVRSSVAELTDAPALPA